MGISDEDIKNVIREAEAVTLFATCYSIDGIDPLSIDGLQLKRGTMYCILNFEMMSKKVRDLTEVKEDG